MDEKQMLRTFGLNIKIERLKLGYPQEKIAEALNFSSVYVSNVEKGKQRISLVNAYRFALFFGKSLDYLLKAKE